MLLMNEPAKIPLTRATDIRIRRAPNKVVNTTLMVQFIQLMNKHRVQ